MSIYLNIIDKFIIWIRNHEWVFEERQYIRVTSRKINPYDDKHPYKNLLKLWSILKQLRKKFVLRQFCLKTKK